MHNQDSDVIYNKIVCIKNKAIILNMVLINIIKILTKKIMNDSMN